MYRPTLVVFAFIAIAASQRSFINKCSLSAPDLEQCFVKNGNLAIEELHQGVEDLDIPSLEGFDVGDLFYSLGEDLSFLLEDGKSYPRGLKLQDAHLKFGPEKKLLGMKLFFFLTNVSWDVKYQAIGSIDNHKVIEKGSAHINFGEFSGNYTVEFKRKVVDGITYLKARNHSGVVNHEKFEFVPQNVKSAGAALLPEQFNSLEKPVVDKVLEISLDLVTFALNQILQEIPENELFLE